MKTISNICKEIALEAANAEINDSRIHIYEAQGFGKKEISLGVSWSSIGTVSPADAAEFAANLAKAAEIAANHIMNGATVVY